MQGIEPWRPARQAGSLPLTYIDIKKGSGRLKPNALVVTTFPNIWRHILLTK